MLRMKTSKQPSQLMTITQKMRCRLCHTSDQRAERPFLTIDVPKCSIIKEKAHQKREAYKRVSARRARVLRTNSRHKESTRLVFQSGWSHLLSTDVTTVDTPGSLSPLYAEYYSPASSLFPIEKPSHSSIGTRQ